MLHIINYASNCNCAFVNLNIINYASMRLRSCMWMSEFSKTAKLFLSFLIKNPGTRNYNLRLPYLFGTFLVSGDLSKKTNSFWLIFPFVFFFGIRRRSGLVYSVYYSCVKPSSTPVLVQFSFKIGCL